MKKTLIIALASLFIFTAYSYACVGGGIWVTGKCGDYHFSKYPNQGKKNMCCKEECIDSFSENWGCPFNYEYNEKTKKCCKDICVDKANNQCGKGKMKEYPNLGSNQCCNTEKCVPNKYFMPNRCGGSGKLDINFLNSTSVPSVPNTYKGE